MTPIVKILFGSHLYGTNTINSDLDYKSVFLPQLSDCILNKIPKSINLSTGNYNTKNLPTDVDIENFSLQYFLQLGFKGETVFLDMIHANSDSILSSTEYWKFIQSNRSKFYTKNLKSYLGYCRKQAAKYGIKGSRLNDCKIAYNALLDIRDQYSDKVKIKEVWDQLILGEHLKIYKLDKPNNKTSDLRVYDVCGRKIMADAPVSSAIETITHIINSYGDRAKKAESNKGVDWKAISHAFRAGFQLKELYSEGDITFPLKDKDFLIKLKLGKFHYLNDGISTRLENLIDEVEVLCEKSEFPLEVNKEFWDEWLVSLYK